ncbi:hypothetical protein GDO81_019786 [Engystomops pustulosus]|uniref:Amino acid permease/ SLC12A domain-containing protein n=1 Tax=Engystomops pustulosus TaxID=76066 RepID=A0AAV6ZJM9_ENGPU|nr:hypothetical protein GDO81_019786 [Engystomops pustulosus]
MIRLRRIAVGVHATEIGGGASDNPTDSEKPQDLKNELCCKISTYMHKEEEGELRWTSAQQEIGRTNLVNRGRPESLSDNAPCELETERVSLVGFLFLLGLYISSLASCMGGLYGAPRILQCIAQEKVIPILSFLGRGRGPNKTPVAAIFLTGVLTMAFVFIGQVNILAPIVTINFMLTYSAVDYSYFSVTMSYDLQRSCRKVGRAASRTPGPLQPLILDKTSSYGSNGTLLEFTKDMDQIFKPGHTDSADSTKVQDKEQKKFIKLKKFRKPAKETLQDSFQLDLQQNQEPDTEATSDERLDSLQQDQTHPEGPEQSEEDMERTGDQEQLVTDVPETEAEEKDG